MSAEPAPLYRVRDGVEDDIPAILALDSRHETHQVVQVYLHGTETTGWEVSLQRERLPRPVELSSSFQRAHLRALLEQKHCLLVAEQPEDEAIVGALAMTSNLFHGFAMIENLVVSPGLRRRKLGTRLLSAAGTWAREHALARLLAEVQTKNTPALGFLQTLGFDFCGFNDRYFSDENIALFFSLPLK
jgi:ribosomal protein S18 acetylase RimI-like enzyme